MGIYKTTISELGDDEVYTSLQKKLDEIRDIPSKVSICLDLIQYNSWIISKQSQRVKTLDQPLKLS